MLATKRKHPVFWLPERKTKGRNRVWMPDLHITAHTKGPDTWKSFLATSTDDMKHHKQQDETQDNFFQLHRQHQCQYTDALRVYTENTLRALELHR